MVAHMFDMLKAFGCILRVVKSFFFGKDLFTSYVRKFFPIYALSAWFYHGTVCPGSSDPPEKIFNIIASENEVYTVY